MSEEQAKGYGRIGWGIGASVLLHVLVGAAFLVRLPMPVNEPAPEETVQVELVPPPEEQKPEEKAPEEKKPEAPKPLNLTMADEPKPEEPKPEPPKPEEPKPEEPKKEEAPPPPPPPPPAPEEPKPEEGKPPEQPTEQPEEAGKGKPQPLDVLRPVVEFGDKDSGPRKAPDGDSSADEGTPDVEPSDAPPVDAPPEPTAPDAPEATKPEQAKGNPVPEIAVPEVSALAASGQGPGAPALPPLPDAVTAALVAPNPLPPDVAEKPDAPPKAAPKPGTKPALPQAKRLFSTSNTGEAVARTAMGSIPRGIRASQLCSTELREQLRHGSPSYSPELLPAYRLASGTVMEVRKGAFRAEAQWYDLSFRCEVDEKVTKVTSFAFEVGSPVPQSQWRKRGFPDF